MGNQLVQKIKATQLSQMLGLQLHGEDVDIERVCPLDDLVPNALTFSTRSNLEKNLQNILVIGDKELANFGLSVLVTPRPRLEFARALHKLQQTVGFSSSTNPPKLHSSVQVGNNVVIGNGVEIGEGTVIYNNVVIGEGVKIGCNCVIKSGAVIGEEGFGFERDENDVPIRILHLGSVVIGNNVEIGCLNAISRGTINDTLIEDNVKIDDLVYIAHNCIIRKNVIITGCVEISGSVEIGECTWVAPNSSITNKVKIGKNAMIGIGAVVARNVESDTTVFGNPSRKVPKFESTL